MRAFHLSNYYSLFHIPSLNLAMLWHMLHAHIVAIHTYIHTYISRCAYVRSCFYALPLDFLHSMHLVGPAGSPLPPCVFLLATRFSRTCTSSPWNVNWIFSSICHAQRQHGGDSSKNNMCVCVRAFMPDHLIAFISYSQQSAVLHWAERSAESLTHANSGFWCFYSLLALTEFSISIILLVVLFCFLLSLRCLCCLGWVLFTAHKLNKRLKNIKKTAGNQI